jgi:hypothetical protein
MNIRAMVLILKGYSVSKAEEMANQVNVNRGKLDSAGEILLKGFIQEHLYYNMQGLFKRKW